jgi:hypothetical protein
LRASSSGEELSCGQASASGGALAAAPFNKGSTARFQRAGAKETRARHMTLRLTADFGAPQLETFAALWKGFGKKLTGKQAFIDHFATLCESVS